MNMQQNKLKSTVKNKSGTTLGITKENFKDEELPREFFLRIRQKTKIGNAFTNNTSMDVKYSKAQLFKILQ